MCKVFAMNGQYEIIAHKNECKEVRLSLRLSDICGRVVKDFQTLVGEWLKTFRHWWESG